MDLPSHADVVALIDSFLFRHDMAPSRLGRDALGEPQFVSEVRDGRMPSMATLQKVLDFMRAREEKLAVGSVMMSDAKPIAGRSHRLNAGAR
jgi:hypothetical protein